MTKLESDPVVFFPGVLGDAGREAAEKARAKSNANLIPFEPGVAQHPEGRRTAGASVKEWYNAFLHINEDGTCKWDLQKLRELLLTPGLPAAMAIAAQDVLLAASSGVKYAVDKKGVPRMIGIDPEVGKARSRLLDRLDGKVPNEHHIKDESKPRGLDEIMAGIAALFEDKELQAFIGLKVGGASPPTAENLLASEIVDSPGG